MCSAPRPDQDGSRAAFDEAIAVTRQQPAPRADLGEPSWWAATIPPGWDVGAAINGGVVLALAANALRGETGRPCPLSTTVHYLGQATAGSADIAVEVLRAGRTRHVAQAAVRQEGVEVARALGALGVLGDVGEVDDVRHWHVAPPPLPPVEECVAPPSAEQAVLPPPPLARNVELRLHPDHVGFAFGRPPGDPVIHAWARLADGRDPDVLALLVFADALPPAVFNAGLPLGWVPTLELTVHVRARPAPGWVRVAARTRLRASGYLDEEAEVWDADDRLVASARQLALSPRAPTPPTRPA